MLEMIREISTLLEVDPFWICLFYSEW